MVPGGAWQPKGARTREVEKALHMGAVACLQGSGEDLSCQSPGYVGLGGLSTLPLVAPPDPSSLRGLFTGHSGRSALLSVLGLSLW